MHLTTLCISVSIQASAALATNLYVAASDGNLTTLSLTPSSNGTSLTADFKTAACGPNPSWLTLDSVEHILYCLDRGGSKSTNGSMNSFHIDANGNLTMIDRVDAPLSGVSAGIYGSGDNRGFATASYNASAVSSIPISSGGLLSDPLQYMLPTLAQAGPVPLRQDRSYLHQVVIDPTGNFVLMPDLGGDMIRVFSYDAETLALLELDPLVTDPGTGPRHGAFWGSASGETLFFLGGELSQKVFTYRISYANAGLSWTKLAEMPALGIDGAKPNGTAPLSEVMLSPDRRFLIVSNRDVSFPGSTQYKSGPTDTMSTFSISPNGTLSLLQLAPSGGWSPRQFSLNRKGDMIAIGHQSNKTVVVWDRDVESGLIRVGEPAATVVLSGAVVCTIWDEL